MFGTLPSLQMDSEVAADETREAVRLRFKAAMLRVSLLALAKSGC